jgi:hypothetical protein
MSEAEEVECWTSSFEHEYIKGWPRYVTGGAENTEEVN